jgi:ADP-heptose:LPS heptosyltransferase
VHKVIEAARLLNLTDDPPAPFLFTSPQTEASADAVLAHGQGPILALGPAANWMGKTWPSERFALTAVALMDKGQPFEDGRVLILGGPGDRRAAEPIRRALPRERWIDLTGEGDLLTAYACLKRARLFIGNDSGLMHLSAAAGTPTLGLFGPSDDRLYAPWGRYGRALRGPRGFAELKTLDPALDQPVCHMLDLKLEQVIAAAKALFEDSRPLFATERAEGPKAAAD